MRALMLVFLILCSISADGMATSYSKPYVSLNYAHNIHDGYATGQQLELGWEFEYDGSISEIKLDSKYTHDFVYNHTDRYSKAAKDKYQDRLIVNEAFMAFDVLEGYWRLGIQKVVWGVGLGEKGSMGCGWVDIRS